jgi:hypothetical protein
LIAVAIILEVASVGLSLYDNIFEFLQEHQLPLELIFELLVVEARDS